MMMYEALDEFPNEPFKFLVSSATSKVNVRFDHSSVTFAFAMATSALPSKVT